MEYGLLTRFRIDKKNSFKSKDQPASAGMLEAVRAELSAKITAVQLSVDALEHSMDSKLNRMLFLMEDQRNDNKASREQFISFDVRLDRVEQEIKDIKTILIFEGLGSIYTAQECRAYAPKRQTTTIFSCLIYLSKNTTL